MADTPDIEAQDVAEVFDEDNTNLDRTRIGVGKDDAEQFEDLPDVYDSTQAVGDDDEDDETIAEDFEDDDDLVDASTDEAEADDEDDDLRTRDGQKRHSEDRLDDEADADSLDSDDKDGVDAADPKDVDLAFVGDMTNVAGAQYSAADLESDTLSDDDLEELDYKEPAR
jgi:hypothetical protein